MSTKEPPQPIPLKHLSEEPAKDNGYCFTIMPFDGYFDSYYQNIYIPAIQAAGLKARRADDIYTPGTIVRDIWALTKDAKVCLADLTGRNANVFYELGLAHAIAKPVVMVTESMEFVPFDLRSLRIIRYDKNRHDWGKTLQETITQYIKDVIAAPLEAVLPAFIETKEYNKPSVSSTEKQLLEMRQELNSIRATMASIVSDPTGHSSELDFKRLSLLAAEERASSELDRYIHSFLAKPTMRTELLEKVAQIVQTQNSNSGKGTEPKT